jgi:hypothetical protein
MWKALVTDVISGKKTLVIKKGTFKRVSDTHLWLSSVVSAKKIRIVGSNQQLEAVQQTSSRPVTYKELQMPSHTTQNHDSITRS